MKPKRCSPVTSFGRREKTQKTQKPGCACPLHPCVVEQDWGACLFGSSIKPASSGSLAVDDNMAELWGHLPLLQSGAPFCGTGRWGQGATRWAGIQSRNLQTREAFWFFLNSLANDDHLMHERGVDLCIKGLTFNPRYLRQSSESCQALQFNWSFLRGRVRGVSAN